MKLKRLAYILPLLVGLATATASALPTSYDPDGVYVFPYGQPQPPTLKCSPTNVCEIILQDGEKVYDRVAGDTVRWLIGNGVAGAHGELPVIFFKPNDTCDRGEQGMCKGALTTNLIITTDRHTYEVTLLATQNPTHTRYGFYFPREENGVSNDAGGRPSASVSSDGNVLGQTVAAPIPERADSKASLPQTFDFQYRIDGNTAYRPTHVYNDGTHTYIVFPDKAPAVTIQVSLPNGNFATTNVHPPVDGGNTVTLDGVPEHILLIGGLGNKTPQINIYHTK